METDLPTNNYDGDIIPSAISFRYYKSKSIKDDSHQKKNSRNEMKASLLLNAVSAFTHQQGSLSASKPIK